MEKTNDGLREMHLFETLDASVTLTVKTKAPTKWLLVDRETGQVFQGSPNGHWDRLDPVIKD